MKELLGNISGLLVLISIIPYAIGTLTKRKNPDGSDLTDNQGNTIYRINPNPATWSLWTFITFSIFLNHVASESTASVWPVLFTFTNPLLITIILLVQGRVWNRLKTIDHICFVFGAASFIAWLAVKGRPDIAMYGVMLGLLADFVAAVPTIYFVWTQPDKERPFSWALFSIGYFLALFTLESYDFANLLLPVYMAAGSFFIALPLIIHRAKHKERLKEWL